MFIIAVSTWAFAEGVGFPAIARASSVRPSRSATRLPTLPRWAHLHLHREQAGAHTSIVGGTLATQGQLGFLAFVQHNDGNGNADFFCSGTVVSPNVILTAGHCAIDETTGAALDPSGFLVATGAVDWTDTTSLRISHVTHVIVDPAYDPSLATSDAALLVLSTPTTAPSIRLATSADQSSYQPGTGAIIAGWGATYAGDGVQQALQWASTVVQNTAYCGQISFSNFSYNPGLELCAVDYPYDDTATCSGDSGGPLFTSDSSGQAVEIGVTSVGPSDCNTDSADYFTSVAPLSSWASSWISALAPAPPPPPPPAAAAAPPPPAAAAAPPASPSASTPKLPSMTFATGRAHVRQTLAGVFGRKFKHGHAYTASCSRKSGIRIGCNVTFWSGPNDYYGTVSVFYSSYSNGTAYWSDTYSMHWVNDQCYYHSRHRNRCQIHIKHGSW